MLTPVQIAHFTTFGFVILRRVFSAAEMTEITREANQIWQEDRESQPQERPYQILFPFVERRPRLAELADEVGGDRKGTRAASPSMGFCSGTPIDPTTKAWSMCASR